MLVRPDPVPTGHRIDRKESCDMKQNQQNKATALYCRLSVEDEVQGESNSI